MPAHRRCAIALVTACLACTSFVPKPLSVLDLASLPSFEFSQAPSLADIPSRLRVLDGQPLEVIGSDLFYFDDANIQLVNRYKGWLHSPPKVQQRVFVVPQKPLQVPNAPGPVAVRGVLHIEMRWEDGVLAQVFRLDADQIQILSLNATEPRLAPVYLISFVPAAVVAVTLVMKRRRRLYRIQNGLCLCCGYDLRASIERCPECAQTITRDAVWRCVLGND